MAEKEKTKEELLKENINIKQNTILLVKRYTGIIDRLKISIGTITEQNAELDYENTDLKETISKLNGKNAPKQ